MFHRWGVAVVLFIQAAAVAWIGWGSCPSKVEVGHMAAAVYFWRTLPLRCLSCQPPADADHKRVAGGVMRPRLRLGLVFLASTRSPGMGNGYGIRRRKQPREGAVVFRDWRWAVIPLLLVGGYFGYRLSRELYGPAAGLVFSALWCVDPLLLGEGATMCPDGAAARAGPRRRLHAAQVAGGTRIGLAPQRPAFALDFCLSQSSRG